MIEKYLEATNLNEKADYKEIRDSLKQAIFSNCIGFCTYINWSTTVNKIVKLSNSNIKKVYVLGFYTGQERLIKRDLDYVSMSKGDEFDLVFPISLFITQTTKAKELLDNVREVTKDRILKIIIETNVLRQFPEPEKVIEGVIKMSEDCGANYIKTNTGRIKRLIPIQDDIKLIQKYTKLDIKAAGGIRTFSLAKELVDLGVKRIGVSYPSQIIEEEKNASK